MRDRQNGLLRDREERSDSHESRRFSGYSLHAPKPIVFHEFLRAALSEIAGLRGPPSLNTRSTAQDAAIQTNFCRGTFHETILHWHSNLNGSPQVLARMSEYAHDRVRSATALSSNLNGREARLLWR